MSKVTEETLKKAYKPFDFVESKKGSIGYIQEVNVNEGQDSFEHQISYSVNWIKNIGSEHNAWWNHKDLTVLGNMFKEIAKCACHPFGSNKCFVDKLM